MSGPQDQSGESPLPPCLIVRGGEGNLRSLLAKEWLIANRIGAYASSTVIGCNVRRYHGLLIAATNPPIGRIVALSSVMERLIVNGETYDLATNEFADAFHPRGHVHLEEFRNDAAATFVYRVGEARLTKEVILAEAANAVAIRYTLKGPAATLRLRPFVALRDYHHLRQARLPHEMTCESIAGGAAVHERRPAAPSLYLLSGDAAFDAKGQWWYRFHYRADIARGQEGFEDLYAPGTFTWALGDAQSCQLAASLGEAADVPFDQAVACRRARWRALAESIGSDADETARRLAVATETFVARRGSPGAAPSATILAGFPWFADWGRDAFISLPGLLLTTRQFDVAREVFQTFSRHMDGGMIPNRFDDVTAAAHYNSIDASLWFIVAAGRYRQATGDVGFWADVLLPAAHTILTAYGDGTRFDIRRDGDGLLSGGSPQTQLTWMDAALGSEVVTPRHGKAVEVNALWHSAHRIMAEFCRGVRDDLASHYARLTDRIAPAFVRAFWNPELRWLNDCIAPDGPDASLRPNQVFAVSLPYSPLSPQQQRRVVAVVREKLLTPMGLRTLSPDDRRYRGRYGGSWESRDRAYHQGTVWAWLLGAFIEGHLKAAGNKRRAAAQARVWLHGFGAHLREAAVGFVSEIFDGDPPHPPRGCIAQAWSVAEILRAKQLITECERANA
jgi:predicted glycogen debranching enzyme